MWVVKATTNELTKGRVLGVHKTAVRTGPNSNIHFGFLYLMPHESVGVHNLLDFAQFCVLMILKETVGVVSHLFHTTLFILELHLSIHPFNAKLRKRSLCLTTRLERCRSRLDFLDLRFDLLF